MGTPIESASRVRDVVSINSDRMLPIEGEDRCGRDDDKKNYTTVLATVPMSLKEDRDLYYCDKEMMNGERKDASVMTNKEEQCAREDDKKMM